MTLVTDDLRIPGPAALLTAGHLQGPEHGLPSKGLVLLMPSLSNFIRFLSYTASIVKRSRLLGKGCSTGTDVEARLSHFGDCTVQPSQFTKGYFVRVRLGTCFVASSPISGNLGDPYRNDCPIFIGSNTRS